MFVKFLVKFDLEFDLKFEISDGKNLVKFLGRTFLPARKARKFRGEFRSEFPEQISEKISETNFATFFGNFVQQKGGANFLIDFFECGLAPFRWPL